MLCTQLERHAAILAQRKQGFAASRERLAEVASIGLQPRAPWAESAPWFFSIFVDAKAYGRSRDELASLPAEDGRGTRPCFVLLRRPPPLREASRARGEVLPETDTLAGSGLHLPTYNTLGQGDIDTIADRVRTHGRGKQG